MADIFISYAREDVARVEKLNRALEAQGFSVWWDGNLATGAR
jgi:adenylate cyclase